MLYNETHFKPDNDGYWDALKDFEQLRDSEVMQAGVAGADSAAEGKDI